MLNRITIPRWFDRHLHIRDSEMMKTVLPCTLKQRATGAIIMPNLADPISSIEKAKAYRERITVVYQAHAEGTPGYYSRFEPCMTCYLTDSTSPDEVVRGFQEGVWRAVKLYMANQKGQGGTTGSAHGVKDLLGRYPVFEAMEKHKIPLLGHFEAVEEDVDEFDREIVSVDRDLKPILKSFPGLPVVFEHLTDGRAADFVAGYGCCDEHATLFATVTAHHLMINRNAMFWGGMNAGHYCKPVPKRESHRQRVRKYVTGGHRRFGAGTDSAPHDEQMKSRCYGCAAGIFTAPTAVEMYTTAFDEDNALEHLGAFLSENFLGTYGMRVSSEQMTIERTPLKVPVKVGAVQVFKGGTELPWKLVG
ncbi:dihydroorotase [Patescibacteria group bacterium]|nr:dihydroorotase [Patescibacteria group bacterium]MDE1946442.1 dihydroorotase [Patescibacteria group bacterium]MDE2011050.1 dihydroorotase [Patescibacteria group bacterium]